MLVLHEHGSIISMARLDNGVTINVPCKELFGRDESQDHPLAHASGQHPQIFRECLPHLWRSCFSIKTRRSSCRAAFPRRPHLATRNACGRSTASLANKGGKDHALVSDSFFKLLEAWRIVLSLVQNMTTSPKVAVSSAQCLSQTQLLRWNDCEHHSPRLFCVLRRSMKTQEWAEQETGHHRCPFGSQMRQRMNVGYSRLAKCG